MVRGFPKSMNIGLAIDKKNGVKSEVVATGKSGKTSKGFNDYQYRIDNGIYSTSGEYEIKKTQNEWQGWGTCLKPSFEPIIVARKPLDGTCINNIMKWGVGGINIDECRVGTEERTYKGMSSHKPDGAGTFRDDNWEPKDIEVSVNGRFPANTILTYDDEDFEEVCGGFPESKGASSQNNYSNGSIYRGQSLQESSTKLQGYRDWYNDDGSAARYFYCAKASKKDRDEGLDKFETKQTTGGGGGIGNYLEDVNSASGKFGSEKAPHKNHHPTVKPTSLMQYLVRLVTPKGGTVLDPFMGSGSTGKATAYENNERNANYKFIGIEMSKEYCDVAEARIDYAISKKGDKDNGK